MLLSNIFQTPKVQMFSEYKSPEYGLQIFITDDIIYVFVPQKLQCSMGIQEFLTNSQKYLWIFQLFIDATKITNLDHTVLFRIDATLE